MSISISAKPVPLQTIEAMREAYRGELNCQIVHDSHHERGFLHSHVLCMNSGVVGYGSVNEADTVKEFYVLPESRRLASSLFRALLDHTRASAIESQTNDSLLMPMMEECATSVTSQAVLFADSIATALTAPGAVFRTVRWYERPFVFRHTLEPVGEWGIEFDRRIIATGGLFFHYNRPFGDIYMEVADGYRQRGFGSFLVQELKSMARAAGHVPAARCSPDNAASQATLHRAGMRPCGRILRGLVAA